MHIVIYFIARGVYIFHRCVCVDLQLNIFANMLDKHIQERLRRRAVLYSTFSFYSTIPNTDLH